MIGAVPEPLPAWLTEARRITVLTGAGISTDSGIPDYRGPDGLWTRDAPQFTREGQVWRRRRGGSTEPLGTFPGG